MKFKRFFFAGALLMGLLAIPAISASAANSSSDPDATLPSYPSAKQWANIKKSYPDLWSKIGYYKTTRPVSVTVKFSDMKDTKTVHQKVVRIPKGTTVIGKKFKMNWSKTHVTSYFQFDFDTLSYALLKPALKANFAAPRQWTVVGAKKMASINKYFVKVSRPTYMPAYSSGDLNKFPGNKVKFSPWNASTDQVRITPDGYVEYTKVNSGQDSYRLFNLVPVSAVKIHKVRVKNNTRYLYYSHHLKGLGDRQVAKTGSTKYRLAVKNLHQPFTMFDGDQGDFIMSKYQLGKTVYYTQSGSYSA
ncbi:hypothetical protein [Lentilactobacillus parafarraginis]|uniref:Uncharacterized protein n=1 Tax=Lentilactobacillus parafarraginis DSM 18390 = JCM 14109 TaxID=1423786 RepID=A0A0R1YLR9_9LACO|nr:hypothetical protein [Lentilactobacillus parafarraginis]KRM43055.1 hypothetical protein FD47_GL001714 [Lentilactobacillus parafarraginis DSM 18390 = JCM 14109]